MSRLDPPLPPISELVPHQPPMRLLSEIESCVGDVCRCKGMVESDMLFVRDGRARSVVLLEHMAQTIAAYVGVQSRRRGEPIEIGLLIGVRRLDLSIDELRVGDEITAQATRLWGDDRLGQFRTAAYRSGETVATAVMTVYRGEIPEDSDLRGDP